MTTKKGNSHLQEGDEARAARQSLRSEHGDPFTLAATFGRWIAIKRGRGSNDSKASAKWCKRSAALVWRFCFFDGCSCTISSFIGCCCGIFVLIGSSCRVAGFIGCFCEIFLLSLLWWIFFFINCSCGTSVGIGCSCRTSVFIGCSCGTFGFIGWSCGDLFLLAATIQLRRLANM